MTRSQSTPHWIEQPAPPDSYRSLFKWGDPKGFRHPNRGMYALLKEAFGMTDADFAEPRRTGMEKFAFDAPLKMDSARLQALGQIVGAENVSTDPYARVRASYGAGAFDALRLREHIIENLPDAVLAPRTAAEVQEAVAYCEGERIPLYVYGGGSGVTRGREAVRGGVCPDLSRHLNKVIAFNEADQTSGRCVIVSP
jgi:alkyldihydroxyacetonephosphate synthase